MHYNIKGSGKPVLMIHGWAMHSGVWADIVEDLSRRYMTITVDLRGHGQSISMDGPYNFATFAEDILSLIQKLKLRNTTLIGWSMGASTILKMFNSSLPCVDSLLLISGNPSLVSRLDYSHGIPEIVVKRLLRQIERDYKTGLQSFHDLLFTTPELDGLQSADKFSMLMDENNVPLKQAAIESLKCLLNEDLRPALDNINIPALFIHGREDRICVHEASHYMHNRIMGSKILIFENTGHAPFITKKYEVLAAINDFLGLCNERNR